MDNKKICFIMCVNQWEYAKEAVHYIQSLWVPDGYKIDIITIEEAESMTEGYNAAMKDSDAKYKVYLHQDVLITEPRILEYMLQIFENPQVGMIGMVGATKLPENGIMWYGKRIGKLYADNIYSMEEEEFGKVENKYQSVEVVDGLLMMTQYDLEWKEDIFDKWDFYDASQSLEFQRKGYQVVVPYMDKPWCLHACGFLNLSDYYEERKKFLMEYKEV